MYQAQTDLTLNEVLTDPLIRAVMHADGVQMAEFKSLLQTAARGIRQREPAKGPHARPKPAQWKKVFLQGEKDACWQ
ncbi:hypothetical protein P6U16_14315 [Rhizobium sp. 32-5/1]|uniref:hypothetical protein n=1 Tax=Rhizobium sp. 32-5/1 TaxID=3019602 RepID=UPI00240D43D1|nr:hypothetical protein [Rhizobium sp. 32-5/1]WEZ82321.1 hypothetical protein P6U16_14315 [Rhizobium sp. 32-5/1]